MIHTNTPKTNEFKISSDACYRSAHIKINSAIAIKLDEISAFGAIIYIIDADKNEIQLSKKKVRWADLINGAGLLSWSDQSRDLEKFKYLKNELMKHALIIIEQ